MKPIVEALTAAAIATNSELGPTKTAIFLDALGGHDPHAVAAAIKVCLTQGKYFPAISEILAVLNESNDAKAVAAWTRVWQATRSAGHRPSVMADPIIAEAVRQGGGFARLSKVLEANEPFERKRFLEAYAQAASAHKRGTLGVETHDGQRAIESPAPKWCLKHPGIGIANEPCIRCGDLRLS